MHKLLPSIGAGHRITDPVFYDSEGFVFEKSHKKLNY